MSVRGPAGMPTLSRRSKIAIGIGAAVLLLLLTGPRLVDLITNWLWLSDLGYTEVMSTVIFTRLTLFVIAAVVVGGLLFGAIALAYRTRPVFVPSAGPNDPLARYRDSIMGRIRWFAIIPPILIGLLAGLVAQASWSTVQTFLNSTPFGITDPEFGLDIGFYAFDLPFYRFILNFLFVIVVVAFIANLITHYVFGGLRFGNSGASISKGARIQLAVLAGTFLLLKAVAYWFDRYTLLSSQRKQEIFTGASYTDLNAVLPSKLILLVIAVICAAAFFAVVVLRDLRIPALATGLMLLSAGVMGVGWPAAMEQFSVRPNEAQREAESIQRNMDATAHAYNIQRGENVTYESNWAGEAPDPSAVDNDVATLSNIRVLDPNVLGPTFNQLQFQRPFYGFPGQLAVDRYTVDGQQRDFIVSVRELDPRKPFFNQQNWLNRHTVYTHGNGFVAAPANTVDAASGDESGGRGGLPVFQVSDLETIRSEGYAENAPIQVSQPRIYFGELISNFDPDYAIVGSDGEDVEYDEEGATYTHSAGTGVSLGNWFNRGLYAIKYAERNLLLSDRINQNSRLLYDRDPRERVEKVAPWLTVDSKTYPAVMDDGSIKWIVDGYTTLDNYPYAQRMSLQDATADAQELAPGQTQIQANREISYARNSVKATVDAYTGEVELYEFDEDDPVLQTWMKVFPGTVNSREDFNEAQNLSEHVRYPEDLFKIQRSLLQRYHVDNPTAFFQGNNRWSVPPDPSSEESLQRQLDQPPYYFTAAPGGSGNGSQFQLTTVMTGFNSRNLAAYITASSDPDTYGQITVKELPTGRQSVGPVQAQENMKTADNVAQERQLVERSTNVTYGNLLTLPVGDQGVLYVQPMYTEIGGGAGGGGIPKLHRVLVYYNAATDEARVGYEPTVNQALRSVGINPAEVAEPEEGEPDADGSPQPQQEGEGDEQAQEGQTPPTTPSPNGEGSPEYDAAVAELGAALEELRTAQASGDFSAYGEALDRLNAAVERYEALQGG